MREILINKNAVRDYVNGKLSRQCMVSKRHCKGDGSSLKGALICKKCYQFFYNKKTGKNEALLEVQKAIVAEKKLVGEIKKFAFYVFENNKVKNDPKHLFPLLAERFQTPPWQASKLVHQVYDDIMAEAEKVKNVIAESQPKSTACKVVSMQNEIAKESKLLRRFRIYRDSTLVHGQVISDKRKLPEVTIPVECAVKKITTFAKKLLEGTAKGFEIFAKNSDPIPMNFFLDNIGEKGVVASFGKKTRIYNFPEIEQLIQFFIEKLQLYKETYSNCGMTVRHVKTGRMAFSSKVYFGEIDLFEGIIAILESYRNKSAVAA